MKKNGKYCNGKKGLNMKPLAVFLALTLLVGCAVGGTIAWLTGQTDAVTNTFTVGDINIELDESSTTTSASGEIKKNYLFVPGDTLEKDPKVTVKANSEDCYLFVKVTSTNNSCAPVNSIVNWDIRDLGDAEQDQPTEKWLKYKEETGTTYYYRIVNKGTTDQSFYILQGKHDEACTEPDNCTCAFKNGYVTISSDVTKGMVETINKNKPALKFDAAAVQFDNIEAKDGKTAVDVAFAQIQWN